MGAFRVLLLTLVFVSYHCCGASPVARNAFRSVIDQYIENGTAAEIIADALVVALKDHRTPLDNVVKYDVGASAPQAVVSVEVNDVSSSEVPDSSLELKAAAERLAEMKAKQKLVSIEILKVNDAETQKPKKVRKIRRRKLVTKGSLRLRTTPPRPTEENSIPTEPSSSEAPATTSSPALSTTEAAPTPTDKALTTTESVSLLTEATTIPSAVPSGDETTSSTDLTTSATSAPTELPTTSELPPSSEQPIVADSAFVNLSESSAQNSLQQTEFVNRSGDGQHSVTSEVATSTPVSTVSTDSSVTSGTVENVSAQDGSTTVQGLHTDKINVENEVLASATHEQPAFTTEMPFTMEVKTLKVVSPTGDSHEVKVLSNVRKVSDVDLSHVHVYPKVPLLNEKSQVAVDIGGLRYRQTPRRIKIKVPKGGDTTNIQPPRGYSLLRGEPTASASHEEFTFVREQTTVPASSSTSASSIETTTTPIPTNTAAESVPSPPETTADSSSAKTESPATTVTPLAAEAEVPGTSVEQGQLPQVEEVSPQPVATTTVPSELSDETATTTARPAPSTDFTNFVDANTEVSVATSISAVESTTEPVQLTTSAAVPELLRDLPLPSGHDFKTILDSDNQRSENSTQTPLGEQQPTTEVVQDVKKPEQVTEDWITKSVENSTPSSDSMPTTSAPESVDIGGDSQSAQRQPGSFDVSTDEAPPASHEIVTVPAPSSASPETSTEPAVTTSEASSAEKQDQVTTTLINAETEIVTEKPSDAVNPIGTDNPLRNQIVDNSRAEPGPNDLSGTLSESHEVTANTPDQSKPAGEAPENVDSDISQQTSNGGVEDNRVPAPPQSEPETTSPVQSIPSDVPHGVPGNIPTSEAVTGTARSEQTGGLVDAVAGQQISDDKSGEQGSPLQNEDRQDPPRGLSDPQSPTESAAVSSDSDKRIEVQEEVIVPQSFPELHDSEIKDAAPESKEVSEEVAAPPVSTEVQDSSEASGEELDFTTASPAAIGTPESAEVSSEVPAAEFKDEVAEKPPTSEEEEEEARPKPELARIPMTVVPGTPPPPTSFPRTTESPHRMVVLDRMNVPVLPFGGNRFAELELQKTDDGSMKMVLNDVMAIIREQDMPSSSEEERLNSGEQSSDEITNPPPILSQPRTEPPRTVVPQVPRAVTPTKVVMPDAPTIIMQIPANSPQAKFSLRRIPGHINVPSVYEILDPERRNPSRTIPQVENGRAIVTLPLLPLRALPPIQQNYYRYNRIPGQVPQQPQQQQQQQFTTPQTFFPQDVYPQQFQTSFPQNYERLFPQSYQNQQGNVFYINTRRRSR